MRRRLKAVDAPRSPLGWAATAGAAGVLVAAVVSFVTVVGTPGSATSEAGPRLGPPAGEAETAPQAPWWERHWAQEAVASGPSSSLAARAPRGAAGDASGDAGRERAGNQLRSDEEGAAGGSSDRPSPTGAAGTTSAPEPIGGESADPGPGAGGEVSVRTVEGFEVAAGSAVAGEGATVRYTVEVEPAVGADLLAVTSTVEEALSDPRSWVVDHRLERVDDPARADVRVVLATPDTVDGLCGLAGLDTQGRYSCWNGTFAALNAMRWHSGAEGFDDLTTYRRYLVNHEFGHGLGHGHVDCPAPGAPAPVMMQQTMSTGECEPNGWPYPDADGP